MATLAQVCKAIVTDAIDHDYIESVCCGQEDLKSIYHSEYGYNGVSPKACMDYLQGLPSVCTVPFYDYEILELLACYNIVRKTDKGRENLVWQYWQECGKQFYMMVK